MPTVHVTYHEVSNELVHGVERANTAEVRRQRRAFIDELKKHILVQSIKDEPQNSPARLAVARRPKV